MCKGWGLNGGEPRLQAAAAVIVPPASAVPGLFLEMRPCSGMIWRPELGGGATGHEADTEGHWHRRRRN